MSILLRGGRIIDPASNLDQTGDILIDGETIAALETVPGRLAADQTIDAEGLIVTPGLIDIHVHFRDPGPDHEETIATGAAAAAHGGFTTTCCMPNTIPALDSVEMVNNVAQQSREQSCRVFPVACATVGRQGARVAPIEAMTRAGAVAFSDDGDVVEDPQVMAAALRACAAVDRPFMQHCQDPAMTIGAAMNAGPVATRLGLTGWPREAEESIITRDVELNRQIGARYHAQHLSSGGSVDIIRTAQADGQPITGEASPHHLLLTEESCLGYNTNAKMNPPLRAQRDIDALKEGIADGTITILATDHAPHPQHRKQTDFASAAFGIVGLDCAVPLYIKALIDDNVIGWPRMIAMMTTEPAKLVGLDKTHGLGRLVVGGPADLTVIDPDARWTLDVNRFRSTGRNCPFDGWAMHGRAVMSILNGRMVRIARYAEQRVTADACSTP